MRAPFASASLTILLALSGCRSSESTHAAWTAPEAGGPGVIVTWTGADSEREDARFFPLTNATEFEAMWTDAVIRHGSSRWPTDHLHPKVDFAHCIGFAWTGGRTWNSRGYDVRAIERVGAEWHVRLAPITYQSHGEGDRVTPYAIVLLTRIAGATIVVDEDVRDLIDAPPQWKERGRLVVPKLARSEPQESAAETAHLQPKPSSATQATATEIPAPVAPRETERFAPVVLAAVRDYDRFKRISDLPAWSPLLCQAPPTGGVLVSASDDGGTHGSKLYHVFAKDPAAYDAAGDDLTKSVATERAPSTPANPAPVGQVLVKEAWHPVPVDLPAPRADGTRDLPDGVRSLRGFGLAEDCAAREGVLYRKGEQADLFVLMKLDPSTADTDQGWVYATVTPDRKRVTAAGKIESCMHCHKEAAHDRQFGLPFDWVTMRQPPR